MKTAVINVIGRIQEVGYRTRVIGLAHVLNIKGYIRNLPDNSVEIVAQDTEDTLKEFIEQLDIKDELIHVDYVKVAYSDEFEGFKDFHKIVGSNETDSRLDSAVNELKTLITAINNMNENLSNKMDETNQSIKNMHKDIKYNHVEMVREIHGIREDNNERVMNEIQEVKTLLKAHLKLS
jgi:acylphosphatase